MVNEEDIRLFNEGENNTPEWDRGNTPDANGSGGDHSGGNDSSGNDSGGNDSGGNDSGNGNDFGGAGNDDSGNNPGNNNSGNNSGGAGNNGANTGGSAGREVKPAEMDEKSSENLEDLSGGDELTEEELGEELKEISSKINKDLNGGDAGTEQPWGTGLDLGNGWILGGVALVVALAVFVLLEALRKYRRRTARRAGHTPAAYVSGGSVAVADYQDIGAREDQQDSFDYSAPELYPQQGVMAVVADGMGGLANGKAVSSALVRTFVDGFPQVSGYYNQTADILLDLSIRANARINQMLRGADRSGSTLVAALVRDGFLHFLTVGDSRIYLYRGGALLQLNREHIYQEELAIKAVNQAVAMAQVRSDRQAHSLTSYFGIGQIPSIDRNDEGIRLVPGDRILLASDGVFGTLSQDQMERALQSGIQEAANQMGNLIRSTGKPYQDNNTLVILEYRG